MNSSSDDNNNKYRPDPPVGKPEDVNTLTTHSPELARPAQGFPMSKKLADRTNNECGGDGDDEYAADGRSKLAADAGKKSGASTGGKAKTKTKAGGSKSTGRGQQPTSSGFDVDFDGGDSGNTSAARYQRPAQHARKKAAKLNGADADAKDANVKAMRSGSKKKVDNAGSKTSSTASSRPRGGAANSGTAQKQDISKSDVTSANSGAAIVGSQKLYEDHNDFDGMHDGTTSAKEEGGSNREDDSNNTDKPVVRFRTIGFGDQPPFEDVPKADLKQMLGDRYREPTKLNVGAKVMMMSYVESSERGVYMYFNVEVLSVVGDYRYKVKLTDHDGFTCFAGSESWQCGVFGVELISEELLPCFKNDDDDGDKDDDSGDEEAEEDQTEDNDDIESGGKDDESDSECESKSDSDDGTNRFGDPHPLVAAGLPIGEIKKILGDRFREPEELNVGAKVSMMGYVEPWESGFYRYFKVEVLSVEAKYRYKVKLTNHDGFTCLAESESFERGMHKVELLADELLPRFGGGESKSEDENNVEKSENLDLDQDVVSHDNLHQGAAVSSAIRKGYNRPPPLRTDQGTTDEEDRYSLAPGQPNLQRPCFSPGRDFVIRGTDIFLSVEKFMLEAVGYGGGDAATTRAFLEQYNSSIPDVVRNAHRSIFGDQKVRHELDDDADSSILDSPSSPRPSPPNRESSSKIQDSKNNSEDDSDLSSVESIPFTFDLSGEVLEEVKTVEDLWKLGPANAATGKRKGKTLSVKEIFNAIKKLASEETNFFKSDRYQEVMEANGLSHHTFPGMLKQFELGSNESKEQRNNIRAWWKAMMFGGYGDVSMIFDADCTLKARYNCIILENLMDQELFGSLPKEKKSNVLSGIVEGMDADERKLLLEKLVEGSEMEELEQFSEIVTNRETKSKNELKKKKKKKKI